MASADEKREKWKSAVVHSIPDFPGKQASHQYQNRTKVTGKRSRLRLVSIPQGQFQFGYPSITICTHPSMVHPLFHLHIPSPLLFGHFSHLDTHNMDIRKGFSWFLCPPLGPPSSSRSSVVPYLWFLRVSLTTVPVKPNSIRFWSDPTTKNFTLLDTEWD